MDARLLRNINLVEVLREEAVASGREPPEDPCDAQLAQWSEQRVRDHYSGACAPPQSGSPAAATPSARAAWFPALARTAVPCPSAVIIALHNAGSAEDMYTSEGTGIRRAPSALLEACRAGQWLLLAPQLPGRALRARERPLPSLRELAAQLLPLIAPEIKAAGGRYALVGHSMGAWAAYELALALLASGLPQPAVACLSAMPWPHIPPAQRPWRQQAGLDEDAFRDECRGWDISEAVLSPAMWQAYQPLLRSDFRLFDEYEPHPRAWAPPLPPTSSSGGNGTGHAGKPPLSCQLALFHGAHDRRVTQSMVEGWRAYSTGAAALTSIDGHHLFPLQPSGKQAWLRGVAATLQAALA